MSKEVPVCAVVVERVAFLYQVGLQHTVLARVFTKPLLFSTLEMETFKGYIQERDISLLNSPVSASISRINNSI